MFQFTFRLPDNRIFIYIYIYIYISVYKYYSIYIVIYIWSTIKYVCTGEGVAFEPMRTLMYYIKCVQGGGGAVVNNPVILRTYMAPK